MRPRSCTRLLASILVLGLLASVVAAAHAPKTSRAQRRSIAQKQLKQANRLRADLEGTPARKRKESDYRKTTRLYQRVYDIAPFSGLAADALAAKAEMQHDMGKQFNSKYWLEAIKTYQFLRKEYPHSKYADDALFNIAQIKQVHLGQKKSALKDYKHFCSAYPKSRYFARARDRIRTIEKQLAAAAKPKRARPKKPPVAPSEAVEVRNIRYWNTNDFTRVVVDLEGKVKYQGARIKNPDRIFFDLFNTKLSTVLTGKSFNVDDGLLARIRVAENRDSVTRVVLEVSGAADYAVFSLPDPFRLVIDV
ncbi:MAG: AMIN domain-containing protein, partial [Terriglobia bacterium]